LSISLADVKSAYSIRNNLHTLFIRTNNRWSFLDGYRGVGILWVIVGHVLISLQYIYGMEWWRETVENIPMYFQWVFNGDIAVDGFLVVSAFLISSILMKQHNDQGRIKVLVFYLSRYMRLTPAYFIAIAIYLMIQPSSWEDKTIWPNLLYVQNFITDYSQYFMYFSWSLAVEEQFYLCLPPFLIFILLKSQNPIRWLIGLFILSFVIRANIILNDEVLNTVIIKEIIYSHDFFAHYFTTIYDNLYSRYGAFICGIFVAYIYRYRSDEFQNFLNSKAATWTNYVAIISMLILCFVPILHKDFTMSYEFNIFWQIARRNLVCMSVTWFLLCGIYSSHYSKKFNTLMSIKLFYPLGHLLYSMYLFHYIAVGFVMLNLHANLEYFSINIHDYLGLWILLGIILSIIGTLFLAILSFLFIEMPIMNLRPK